MRLILKVTIALAFVTAASAAYADIPDVSKWSCVSDFSENFPNYGLEVMNCDSVGSSPIAQTNSLYIKVSGELIYIHEHRIDADNDVYYNALKTENSDRWVEVVNKKDLIFDRKLTEKEEIEVSISDDNGAVLAKRIIPLLKK